ncbi:hypothetical protein BD770DRAFT_476140 [Pilaira anomala]|nr:hypothetical protein BD770DRAFT_476140 [Pilaira anomala]
MILCSLPTEPFQSPQNGPVLFSYQNATFHPRSGKLYFIGGFYHIEELEDMTIPLSYTITYDTYKASWGNQTLNPTNTGDIPSPRHRHTATMFTFILHTKEDILIYGGSTEYEPKPSGL